LLVIFTISWLMHWKRDEPRRHSFEAVRTFAATLNSGDADALLQTVVLPAAVSGRTSAEPAEFLTKALRDEVSPEGLAVLRREGQFGPLQEMFPQEAAAWATQAGVKLEDCVAFKLERNGLRAEVVLLKLSSIERPASGIAYRILRCNNVKQLAANI
jgi:hypothetical protein